MLKEVSIEILRKCPNHCLHCSSMSSPHCTEILGYGLFTSVIDDAVELGADRICLSGGEPFLHPDLVNMVSYIHEKGVHCSIYTSGIWMNPNGNYEPLPAPLIAQIYDKATKLIFNVEAATEATYNRIMGTTGCFQMMKQSIGRASQYGLVTEANFVPMGLNIDEIESTVALCQELGLSQISFLRLVLHGRALQHRDALSLSDEAMENLKDRLRRLQSPHDLKIRIGIPLSSDAICHKCQAANGKLNIKYDGCVYPCEVFKNDRVTGQLQGLKPERIHDKRLKEIYNKSRYLNDVREMWAWYSSTKPDETCIGQYFISKENL